MAVEGNGQCKEGRGIVEWHVKAVGSSAVPVTEGGRRYKVGNVASVSQAKAGETA